MSNSKNDRLQPPPPLKSFLENIKKKYYQDLRKGEFYTASKLLDQMKIIQKGSKETIEQLKNWLHEEPKRIAFGSLSGSIESIEKTYPAF